MNTVLLPHSVRLPGETDEQLRGRASRMSVIAMNLVTSALANPCVREFIADPALPYSVDSVRGSPPIRLEFDEAIALGELGSCLSATRNKHWGNGPYLMPLSVADPLDPFRVLYLHRPESKFSRRFHQRQRLKQLLGKRHRSLVTVANRLSKAAFLRRLTSEEATAIQRRLKLSPGLFWRAAQGKAFPLLPARIVQQQFSFMTEDPMDPTTCYQEMLEALHEGNQQTARERAQALREWLGRGGFYPPECDKAEVDAAILRALR